MNEYVTLAIILALFNVDVTAYGQFMISRPIFCAPIIGFAFGNIEAGLWIGIVAEMLWISHLPMGTSVPFSITAVTLLTTVWSVKYFGGQSGACALAMAIALPMGMLFRALDLKLRYFNSHIVHWIGEGITAGDEKRISFGIFAGIFLFFAKAFLFYLLLLYPGRLLMTVLMDWMPPLIFRGLSISWHALPFVGFAVVLTNSCFTGNSCRK